MKDKEHIPGEWNSQREAKITLCYSGPVEGSIKDENMVLGGLICQKDASEPFSHNVGY